MAADREMSVSVRKIFREGDPEWADYLDFVGLPHLSEVRTIDTACNPCRERLHPIASLDELWEEVERLPRPVPDREYDLLVVEVLEPEAIPAHPRLKFLGYDLSDDTWTSSLLNCGRWEGVLEPIARRTARNGLLGLGDARLAQALLPEAWGDDPHAFVTIWALFEVIPG